MEYRDQLAGITDEDLARLHEEPAASLTTTNDPEDFHHLYIYDDYRWKGFETDCAVVKLTKGYFTFVEHEDLQKMDILGNIWTNETISPYTGKLKVRAWCEIRYQGIKIKMSLHRFLMDAKEGDYIDHFNHHTLDNRTRRNLFKAGQGVNIANRRLCRGSGLPRGVINWGNGFKGRIGFNKKQILSEETWETPEPAHVWYLAKHAKLYGYTDTVGAKRERNYPLFPPKKGARHRPVGTAVDSLAATF